MKNALYIVWQASNEAGIPILDEQHRGIVSVINSLHHSIRHGNVISGFEPTMKLLHRYTALHFQDEEALMKDAGFAGIREHIKLHEKFMVEMNTMTKNLAQDDDVRPLLSFLRDWWLSHINKEDRDYVPGVKRYLGLP